MTAYMKVCWYCQKVTMELTGDFYTCRECGATWNPLPELSPVAEIDVLDHRYDNRDAEHRPVPQKTLDRADKRLRQLSKPSPK